MLRRAGPSRTFPRALLLLVSFPFSARPYRLSLFFHAASALPSAHLFVREARVRLSLSTSRGQPRVSGHARQSPSLGRVSLSPAQTHLCPRTGCPATKEVALRKPSLRTPPAARCPAYASPSAESAVTLLLHTWRCASVLRALLCPALLATTALLLCAVPPAPNQRQSSLHTTLLVVAFFGHPPHKIPLSFGCSPLLCSCNPRPAMRLPCRFRRRAAELRVANAPPRRHCDSAAPPQHTALRVLCKPPFASGIIRFHVHNPQCPSRFTPHVRRRSRCCARRASRVQASALVSVPSTCAQMVLAPRDPADIWPPLPCGHPSLSGPSFVPAASPFAAHAARVPIRFSSSSSQCLRVSPQGSRPRSRTSPALLALSFPFALPRRARHVGVLSCCPRQWRALRRVVRSSSCLPPSRRRQVAIPRPWRLHGRGARACFSRPTRPRPTPGGYALCDGPSLARRQFQRM
ncbi:hypothetical protein TvY486_0021500 [Trypanosoma vivax Y486]|uniref:Uncharacterized protein n=1 Tax=Trypanosoma vivax (strain Y486) TaxID=1055687 RepID=F9WPH1_TRYVY|nr:hypothetical protein TvY486_0021500 [Trypanosoma vivax Y486]|eukprot:CCD19448.1 hypothetical protein TvY486_0021500 [Trypanosoma vivax Y486]